jgi:glutamate synthase (NADPH) large chain
VPVNSQACGAQALKTLPHIEQVFVNCRVPDRDEASTEQELRSDAMFYAPSLSASTLVFKAG